MVGLYMQNISWESYAFEWWKAMAKVYGVSAGSSPNVMLALE